MKKILSIALLSIVMISCAKLPIAVSQIPLNTQYEVIGPVEIDSYAVLDVFGTDGSYEALVDKANEKYDDDNLDVINVSTSSKRYILWSTFNSKGTVIKYSN